MANMALWLVAVAWPVVRKVMTMLGIGIITYEALTTLVGGVVDHAVSNWGAMTGAALQLCSLGGIPEVLGIITGALVARVSYVALGKIGRVVA